MAVTKARRSITRGKSGPSEAIAPLPALRYMTVMAQDPSVHVRGRSGAILMAKVGIPAEDLIPGPTGYRVQVVDYDASARRFNGAHDLPKAFESEPKAWKAGAPRIVNDYLFHAQNAYALVMRTLARFEYALGRRVGWSFKHHQLKVATHGMFDANAFYSPGEEGLVFGYFLGKMGDPVYTCLSHDVVVHETTHALVDALRERYMDPSSPDQAAFHEGLADVIALLSVFSLPEVLRELMLAGRRVSPPPALIAKEHVTAEALRHSVLFGLAEQMGKETQSARGNALRHSASLPRDPSVLGQPEFVEPHRRGEVLVAAVTNGLINAWAARIVGSGVPGQTHFPVVRVAEEGADIADALATMWIRALDYMPPVHLEFPDALSAAITADYEVRPDDSRFHLRSHILKSFASYGISPASKGQEPAGSWARAPGGLRYDRVRFESLRSDKDEVFRFLWENRKELELREGVYGEVLSVRPCARIGMDGFVLHETVAEYYQVARLTPKELRWAGISAPKEYLEALREEKRIADRRRERLLAAGHAENATELEVQARETDDGEDTATTPLYGGGVLIFDEYGRLKYHVHNDVFNKRRQAKRLEYLWQTGQLEPGRDGAGLRITRLSAIHRLRALDGRQSTGGGW